MRIIADANNLLIYKRNLENNKKAIKYILCCKTELDLIAEGYTTVCFIFSFCYCHIVCKQNAHTSLIINIYGNKYISILQNLRTRCITSNLLQYPFVSSHTESIRKAIYVSFIKTLLKRFFLSI